MHWNVFAALTAWFPASLLGAVSAGFLIDAPANKLGLEATAAWALATNHAAVQKVFVSSEGRFRDEQGREVALDAFGVLWYHQGDSGEAAGPAYSPITVVKLRQWVSEGHGLFLSGAALGMVEPLGLENFATRRAGPGTGPFATGLLPAQTKHPVFEGLSRVAFADEAQFLFNDQGYAAFSDFHGTPGPTRGMLLARANSSGENPFVEYELGNGRVIVLGWRVPHYRHAHNPHRSNLERLTVNVLSYLAEPKSWQKVIVTVQSTQKAVQPGITQAEWRALEMAIADLSQTFQDSYGQGKDWLGELASLRREHDALTATKKPAAQSTRIEQIQNAFKQLKAKALLSNPLLNFEKLLFIERNAKDLGLPANWESNSSLKKTGHDNRFCTLSPVRPNGKITTLYEPGGRFVGDVDLHWNADRFLLSMPGSNGRWQVHEMALNEKAPQELTLIREPDVDNYDACYLPDGRIVFTSTAPFRGVPCVYGASHIANLYIREHNGSIRQVTVDQEHNWCPTVLNSGRILYLRWEYTDLPHSNSRRLFHMNPDGTAQMEYLSSSSYFPNSFFYARPIPGHPTMVVGIATGHHGNARTGRLLIMDPARGRQESQGVVQEIPGCGTKVTPLIRDPLADGVWPQFLHPFPLSEKYFLVSARPGPQSSWGIYLVDVFDNMLCLAEKPGYALLEPIPVKPSPVPPVIVDRIDPARKDAVVQIVDIYQGGGLRGIPRGTVKNLRLFTYHFSYQGMGGLLGSIGMDGPWDIKQVLGTVPVEPDGSALFRVPAYTPVSLQPLDSEGKAMQLMRSWFTAMPGEFLSCAGCHEQQNSVALNSNTLAGRRPPSEIKAWHGPTRGFSFAREVQPVLDRHCVQCHHGLPWTATNSVGRVSKAVQIADLRGDVKLTNWSTQIAGNAGAAVGGKFSVAYAELHRFVRRPGIESDIHMLAPMEFHADSTELVQLLRKGHYGVHLGLEEWERLVTWIDLNAPYHGTWREIVGDKAVQHVAGRARALRKQFTGMDEDPEKIPDAATLAAPLRPAENPNKVVVEESSAVPQHGSVAKPVSAPHFANPSQITIDLEGVKMELVRIEPGEFVMGSSDGPADERPASAVRIDKAFWMGRFEVSNEQFARFDAAHDSHVEPMHGYQFGIHGYPVNTPKQPVVRVSWHRAKAFCQWLSARTGRQFDLPTEAHWEYACRAGTTTSFAYGPLETDFSKWANLGDIKLRDFALETYVQVRLIPNPNQYDDWVPQDNRFNDGHFVSADIGSYRANPWGLHDMHGNVWEWTRSALRPYPYREDDGRNNPASNEQRVVRGGSWYDRPMRGTSSYRLGYAPYQGVFNVGFRVVMEEAK